eukprot:871196-Pleurochrysis_carterae.AAC.1
MDQAKKPPTHRYLPWEHPVEPESGKVMSLPHRALAQATPLTTSFLDGGEKNYQSHQTAARVREFSTEMRQSGDVSVSCRLHQRVLLQTG